jgi:hypothetical protein
VCDSVGGIYFKHKIIPIKEFDSTSGHVLKYINGAL